MGADQGDVIPCVRKSEAVPVRLTLLELSMLVSVWIRVEHGDSMWTPCTQPKETKEIEK